MLQQFSANWLFRHLLFWVGVIAFFFVGYYTQPEVYSLDPIPFLFDLLFASLLSFLFYSYMLVYGLLPLALKRSYGWFVVMLVSLNIVASLLYNMLGYIQLFIQYELSHDSSRFANTISFTNPFVGPFIFESNLVAAFMVCIKLIYRWYQKQQEGQQLEGEKLKAELQLLKLQLNPGFLFRTLSQLHHLIQQRDKQAPEVVLNLAHFLRYVLYESQAGMMPLVREIDMIKSYISLQRIVHSARLEVSFAIRGDSEQHFIEPLSLFLVVENAFHQLPVEHSDEPAWISIDMAINPSQLVMKVISGQSSIYTDTSNQFASMRKQLYFHYADRHHLQVWQEDQVQVVTVTISFPTNGLESALTSTHSINDVV